MALARTAIACAILLIAAAAQAAKPDASYGIWQNPGGSVRVRAEPCGQAMCGVVVWASDKAIADARKGSDQPLVGSTLFRDFRKVKDGVWRGRVYVPDIGKTFSGTITVRGKDRLEGKGCLVGGIGCRSQMWTRLPG